MDANETVCISLGGNMPDVKIKDLKGMFTYVDENDISHEALTDGYNFEFQNGYAPVTYEKLSNRSYLTDMQTGSYTWVTSNNCANIASIQRRFVIVWH